MWRRSTAGASPSTSRRPRGHDRLRAADRARLPGCATLPGHRVTADFASRARRAAIIVLDGLGIGPAPDTDAYGDAGSNTLGNVARAVGGLACPSSRRSASAAARRSRACRRSRGARRRRTGSRSRRARGRTARPGTGSSAASCSRTPFPTYPHGFPADVIDEFARRTGRGRAGQPAGLGHPGARPVRRGASPHRQVDRLHLGRQRLPGGGARGRRCRWPSCTPPAPPPARCCRASTGCPGSSPGRSSASRAPGCGHRARKDFSLPPPGPTLLDRLAEQHVPRVGVGQGGRPVRRPGHLEHPHGDQRRGLRVDRGRAAVDAPRVCCWPT